MTEPIATLELYADGDIEAMRDILNDGYVTIKDQYEREDEPSEYVMLKGSLCQELLTQLNDQDD